MITEPNDLSLERIDELLNVWQTPQQPDNGLHTYLNAALRMARRAAVAEANYEKSSRERDQYRKLYEGGASNAEFVNLLHRELINNSAFSARVKDLEAERITTIEKLNRALSRIQELEAQRDEYLEYYRKLRDDIGTHQRFQAACAAMTGLLANERNVDHPNASPLAFADAARQHADALLARLKETGRPASEQEVKP